MTQPVIEFRQCHKRFARRARPALRDLSCDVHAGRVTALLGPNGSGKSTLLRAASGLLHLTSGSIQLLGAPVPGELWRCAHRVGVVPDNPSWFRRFDLTTTVELVAGLRGVPTARAGHVLHQVGLSEAAGAVVATLSLGMRRRLALAIALLHEPELLILDEPANGLDPEGHAQLRTFLTEFVRTGGSVLLSSHLLADVEQIADDVVVVVHGTVVEAGPLQQFVATSPGVVLRVAGPPAHAARVLRGAGIGCRIESRTPPYDITIPVPAPIEQVSLVLAAHGIGIMHLAAIEVPLEERYLQLVAGATGGVGGSADRGRWGA